MPVNFRIGSSDDTFTLQDIFIICVSGYIILIGSGHQAERCENLQQDAWEERIREKTGLIIDPYFSATAISWILDNVPGAREKAGRGELLFGTTDSWLIWNLTGGRVHSTDYSNACRTMLFNINTLEWDGEIMEELGIPMSLAPEVCFSDHRFGETTGAGTFSRPVPITGVMGDSHAALFGQLCFSPGMTCSL